MNHQDDEATLDPSEDPTLPAITDPDAVTRALGVQVHLIRTQFVRDRLASGQCTAKQIASMVEWEQHAGDNIRMNNVGAMYWGSRLSPFDRPCISLEVQEGFQVPAEQYDSAKRLDEACRDTWQLRRHEDRDAAREAIATLKQLGERLGAEVDRLRTGPDRSAAGVLGALLRIPESPPAAPALPALEPEARDALVEAMQSARDSALAARDRLRRWCEDVVYRQGTWQDQRATVDPTRVLLGFQVDLTVSDLDEYLADSYELMGDVWKAVTQASRTVDTLKEVLAAADSH